MQPGTVVPDSVIPCAVESYVHLVGQVVRAGAPLFVPKLRIGNDPPRVKGEYAALMHMGRLWPDAYSLAGVVAVDGRARLAVTGRIERATREIIADSYELTANLVDADDEERVAYLLRTWRTWAVGLRRLVAEAVEG